MKLVAAFIMLMPSIPFVYYGDEIGLPYREGLASKEGGYFRTGSRTPMQWDGGKNRGFSSADGALYLPVDMSPASPDVQAQAADENSLLNTVKRFARLRAGEEALQAAANLELVYAAEGEYPFVFRRGKFVVAVNPCARQTQAALPQGNSACGKASERQHWRAAPSCSERSSFWRKTHEYVQVAGRDQNARRDPRHGV